MMTQKISNQSLLETPRDQGCIKKILSRAWDRLPFKLQRLDDVSLFHDWLNHLEKIFNSTDWKVLLLVDNCSVNESHGTASKLESVELYFLLLNSTLKTQPCDTGTIATLRGLYQSYQVDPALDIAEDKHVKKIYKVDVFSAMQAWKRI